MAKPASSSQKNLMVCAADHVEDQEEEESGWTSYFEDFSSNNTNNSSCFSFCGDDHGGPSSFVSDAASSAACKFSLHHNHRLLSSLSSSDFGVPPNLPDHMKLRFKKSRAHQISEDDSLEDTATSPLNSPKDGDLNPTTEIISRKRADHDLCDDSKGKVFTSENISDSKKRDDEDDKKNSKGKNNNMKNYGGGLKKRGFSLFPLSMSVHYFG